MYSNAEHHSYLVEKVSGNGILTTTPAEGVSLVVALSEAGGTLRYNRRQSLKFYRGIEQVDGISDLDVLILN